MLKVTNVEQLKAIVERLTHDRDEAEAALTKARLELHEAEREERRNAKLTPAMLRVLKAMADGASLYSSRFNLPESYWTDRNGDGHEAVRSSVFDGLRSREAIDEGERTGTWSKKYSLTEHGRQLAIR